MTYLLQRQGQFFKNSSKLIYRTIQRSGTNSRFGNMPVKDTSTPSIRTDFSQQSRGFALNSQICNRCWGSFTKYSNNTSVKSNQKCQIFIRSIASGRGNTKRRNTTALLYICAIGVGMVGMSYAGVPLYRIFCQASGLGGQPVRGHDTTKVGDMSKVEDRIIRVQFNADTASSMQWNFRPQQSEVRVAPGETALAFYTAKNPTDKPITGISTYNVLPFEAGLYFNKIQCFCFEEQRLNPHEQVDMPVFFFIDPEFAEDPKMEGVDKIVLSYTFFEAKEGFEVPVPPYLQHWKGTA